MRSRRNRWPLASRFRRIESFPGSISKAATRDSSCRHDRKDEDAPHVFMERSRDTRRLTLPGDPVFPTARNSREGCQRFRHRSGLQFLSDLRFGGHPWRFPRALGRRKPRRRIRGREHPRVGLADRLLHEYPNRSPFPPTSHPRRRARRRDRENNECVALGKDLLDRRDRQQPCCHRRILLTLSLDV